MELSSDGDKTLKNFLQYRRKTLIIDHPNDNAQLLTREQFESGVVGKFYSNLYSTFALLIKMNVCRIVGVCVFVGT